MIITPVRKKSLLQALPRSVVISQSLHQHEIRPLVKQYVSCAQFQLRKVTCKESRWRKTPKQWRQFQKRQFSRFLREENRQKEPCLIFRIRRMSVKIALQTCAENILPKSRFRRSTKWQKQSRKRRISNAIFANVGSKLRRKCFTRNMFTKENRSIRFYLRFQVSVSKISSSSL